MKLTGGCYMSWLKRATFFDVFVGTYVLNVAYFDANPDFLSTNVYAG
jgi:hypothetical protein